MAEPSSRVEASAAIDELLAHPPVLHGHVTHGLVADALRWIGTLPRPLRTLETGCGMSTLVFAARGDRHLCITPAQSEADAVRAYCDQHGIDAGGVTFQLEQSETALPSLDRGRLDLVLIDGSHAFPTVFVDWLYTVPHLEVGGTLVIDDVHLWTGKILRDFLAAEPEWEIVDEWLGRTTALRKLGDAPYRDWYEQQFVLRRSTPTRTRLRMSASLLRRGDVSTLRVLVRDVLRRR
jgi:predicted O-methyltransferase YrrM